MIVGLGLDVVDVARVAAILERSAESFLRRILHADEDAARARTAEGPAYVSGQFAAKEAVMKALGTGMAGAAFGEIAVLRGPGGAPYVELYGAAAGRAQELDVATWHVSITHSRTTAAAVAIAER